MIQLNGVPFDRLRIAYFRAFDKPHEKVFLDATDEQILVMLSKEYCETVLIMKIEDVHVLEVTTHIPKKRKLNIDELKMGKTNEEIIEYNKKLDEIKAMRNKYK